MRVASGRERQVRVRHRLGDRPRVGYATAGRGKAIGSAGANGGRVATVNGRLARQRVARLGRREAWFTARSARQRVSREGTIKGVIHFRIRQTGTEL